VVIAANDFHLQQYTFRFSDLAVFKAKHAMLRAKNIFRSHRAQLVRSRAKPVDSTASFSSGQQNRDVWATYLPPKLRPLKLSSLKKDQR